MKNSVDSPFGFDKSAALASRLVVLEQTESTNTDAAAAVRDQADPATDFSVFVTDNQTAGRGRLGRVWVAPPGKALAISVVVKPVVLFDRPDSLAWLPLLAGVAMTRAVRTVLGDGDSASAVALKWPNDVLINGHKVSGILTELIADQQAVIIGSGVNIALDDPDLPTPTSTSLKLAAGHAPGHDEFLTRYLTELRERYERFVATGGDAEAAGLFAEVLELCGTIGERVRVDLPGETQLHGQAIGIDSMGRIIVADSAGTRHTIAAGDVTHLRVEP